MNFQLKELYWDDGTPEGVNWFESSDTLMLNIFGISAPIVKLSKIKLYIYNDNQEDGNYSLVVLDTLGNIIWESNPVPYRTPGDFVTWSLPEEQEVPQIFLVGIKYNVTTGWPQIGVDTNTSGGSVMYVVPSGQFFSLSTVSWMIRAIVSVPECTTYKLQPMKWNYLSKNISKHKQHTKR